jgi:hypothetical protein
MKLIIERSGGFVASSKKPRGEREGSALSAEQRAALDMIMRRTSPYPPPTRSEQFTYRVEVQDENGTRHVTVPEFALVTRRLGRPPVRMHELPPSRHPSAAVNVASKERL